MADFLRRLIQAIMVASAESFSFCHSERSRGISNAVLLPMIRDVTTPLEMTTAPAARVIFKGTMMVPREEASGIAGRGGRDTNPNLPICSWQIVCEKRVSVPLIRAMSRIVRKAGTQRIIGFQRFLLSCVPKILK
jgi:hypothetical protein